MRRLVPFLILLGASCGKQRASTPVPQSPNTAISQFMDAVKANDLDRMGNLWGSTQGPAVTFWDRDRLRQHLATMQKYLDHNGYRIIEGPLPVQPLNPRSEEHTSELQSQSNLVCRLLLEKKKKQHNN